jgi:hypothetical protein
LILLREVADGDCVGTRRSSSVVCVARLGLTCRRNVGLSMPRSWPEVDVDERATAALRLSLTPGPTSSCPHLGLRFLTGSQSPAATATGAATRTPVSLAPARRLHELCEPAHVGGAGYLQVLTGLAAPLSRLTMKPRGLLNVTVISSDYVRGGGLGWSQLLC